VFQAEELEKLVHAKQAKIDALMFEYCPEEMGVFQVDEWEEHQELSTVIPLKRRLSTFVRSTIAVLALTAAVGWTALFVQTGHIQFGVGDINARSLQKVKVFNWNQAKQSKGAKVE
ncbi:MAG: hypothetical protein V3S69_05060, partial [Dehalococcoidales bacterium]